MEILSFAAFIAFMYGAYKIGWKGYAAAAEAYARYRAPRRAAKAHEQRIRFLARAFQVPLVQLDQAPDFRRAAALAEKAQEVPVVFRQRQFHRFRPRLIQHFATQLRAGTDSNVLTSSLAELLQHLGIAPCEADYIRIEAERQLAAPRAAPAPLPYGQQLVQIQRDHEQRAEALRQANVDAETREQLLEAEEGRFRQALLELGEEAPPGSTL
jgi:hypothetical protein